MPQNFLACDREPLSDVVARRPHDRLERDRSINPAGRSKLMAVDVASRVERTVYAFPPWGPERRHPQFSPDGTRILPTS